MNDGSKKSPILVTEIKSKDRKCRGNVYPGQVTPGHMATIMPGEYIVLHGTTKVYSGVYPTEGPSLTLEYEARYERTFKLGDFAEYDSYNLSYYGEIVAITAKTVTIKDKHSDSVHRLDLAEFDRRNYDFDWEEAFERNADTMQHI